MACDGSGYELKDNACEPKACPSGYSTSVSCKNGKKETDSSYYSGTSVCKQCVNCDAGETCACSNGKVADGNGNCKCPAGKVDDGKGGCKVACTYSTESDCKNGISHCGSCSQDRNGCYTCSACDGSGYELKDNACKTKACPSGYSAIIMYCSNGKKKVDSSYYSGTSVCKQCVNCNAGETCACKNGKVADGNGNCKCPAGKVDDGKGGCKVPCTYSTESACKSGISHCGSCSQDSNGCYACSACDGSGYELKDNACKAKACPSGYSTSVSCKNGTKTETSGYSGTLPCKKCVNCDAGEQCACPAGQVSDGKGGCKVACKYSTESACKSGTSNCKLCSKDSDGCYNCSACNPAYELKNNACEAITINGGATLQGNCSANELPCTINGKSVCCTSNLKGCSAYEDTCKTYPFGTTQCACYSKGIATLK